MKTTILDLDEREIFEDLVRNKYLRLLKLKKETIARIGKYPVSNKDLLAVAIAEVKRDLDLGELR